MIDEKKLLEKLEELKFANEEKGYDTAKDVIQEIINLVNEQPKTDWISCEVALPEAEQKVRVTVLMESGKRSAFETIYRGAINTEGKSDNTIEYETWGHDGAFYGSRVVAWHPLMEPYKKEGVTDDE